MGILESLKKATEQATGIARPRKQELAEFVKMKKPLEFRFKDDGLVPNHPFWPFVVYRGAVRSVEQFDSAAVLEELFEAIGWSSGWRDGIYHYVHYHSRKNEVLGVAGGTGKVRFGPTGAVHCPGRPAIWQFFRPAPGSPMFLRVCWFPGGRRLSRIRRL
ncbi:hypothetical protein [Mesorhizobium sp. M0207]|uniref:hypothetical protein n=1 Tax=Mesorhizobium sp. M0207 TaxID=2956915 RepID=UPI003336223E